MDRREQSDAVRTDTVDAEVIMRVRAYQQEDPNLTFEAGYHQVRHRDPDLWRRYGDKTCARLMTTGGDPAEQRAAADWHEAGLEVLREADRYQQQYAQLSRADAIRAVLRDNAALTRRYVRGSYPPGT